ncbi:MAG: hypothetical protein GQ527_01770, partial [Bacteroidales bacterium]|nr:hypothetical protein [Bacteroidales bacterium]
LLANIFRKTTAWLTAFIMLVFTFLTLNDALYNPVPDCGCFGDFILLTNWETFYKNLIIDFFLVFVFITRNSFESPYKKATEWSIAILTIGVFTLFNSYNINRLPIIDYRDWKIGKNLIVENPQPLEYFLIYTNNSTGEAKEYLSPNYPFNDSIWMAEWTYTDMRIVDPNEYPNEVSFFSLNGDDVSLDIIGDPLYHFLLISYDINEGNWDELEEIRIIKEKAEEDGYSFSMITASSEESIDAFQKDQQFYANFYQSDDIDLKTIIRSNPGLIVLKDGQIRGKWAHGHLPSYEETIKEE